jgi:hypothetical protein
MGGCTESVVPAVSVRFKIVMACPRVAIVEVSSSDALLRQISRND